MAKFDESKVINALHPEKAEVGKKYWYSDNLVELKRYVEENNAYYIGELSKVEKTEHDCVFHLVRGSVWQFLYPYKEPPKQRMTNIQLMEWMSKGNGVFKYDGLSYCYLFESFSEEELNDKVAENIVIRTWDSEEWIEPTVGIYERDCRGKENV